MAQESGRLAMRPVIAVVAMRAVMAVLPACGSVMDLPLDAGPDAPPSTASVTVELPRYLDLAARAEWRATVQGPPSTSFRYAWKVSPGDAATLAPEMASSALDADGNVTLTGTITGGAAATKASLELAVTGDAAGTASSAIEVVKLQAFGYRDAFAQSSGTVLNAGRLLALPLTMPAGLRVIGFGLRAEAPADVRIGLYGTSGAAPGDLLAASPVISAVVGENTVFLAASQQVDAQPSYLALVASADLSISVDAQPSHAVNQFAIDLAAGAPLPSPFMQTTAFAEGPIHVFVIAVAP